jgi:hypothetical protein
MDEIEEILSQKFTAIGWHFLGGITLPFRGPYIYEKLTKKKYQIRLPLGIRSINVFFMENFHSLSWLDFATFGNRGTGGWAKQEGLYCVLEKYDVKSVEFTNSYLKHEAQHFDDYTRFPHLLEGHQSTLEFRAKLAELIYSESTESFRYFMKEAKNDKNFPHLLASYNIKTEFSKKLSFSDETSLLEFEDLQVIKTTALEIYLEHTRKLEDQLVVHREKPVELVL